ncbi:hypothetical protein PFISCL1PPCAC_8326 [Pristionchus fissidentatus]|uniref:BED-type domain-containing protein n=1 Tax=Pristionchus fissidentatus TaxID=1538716 RepID=A0AAV5VC63_9BILA|nr:hypothetical protein PFISCL1PPCAC_8326 [Pristionchus fissidentatus]
MAPPTSLAWQYFTVGEFGMAQCHLCLKHIRIVRNTSPLIAHLRCKHPEVLPKIGAETTDSATQTGEELTQAQKMEYDMNYRLREMMALRLDDAVGNMQFRVTTDPMAQLVRALCESSMWLIRDWPNQKIDNYESVRASRLDTLGRLRQLLRARPPKSSEMDGLILLLADALLTISEQWPGGESDVTQKFTSPKQQIRQQSSLPTSTSTVPATSVHIPPVYGGAQGNSCKPPAPKLQRMQAKPWTVDGYQQPSTSQSASFPPPGAQQRQLTRPHRESPQAHNAGSPSLLWTFFRKEIGDNGVPMAACKVCQKRISCANHGTTGMKGHLKVHHPDKYATLGMESSASSEASQSSPPGVSDCASPQIEGAMEKEKNSPRVSAIIAALNGEMLPEVIPSPLFDNNIVKEEPLVKEEAEEMEFDEDLYDMNNATLSSLVTSPAHNPTTRFARASDIWSYFTKGEVGNDKHGFCNLCEWNRRIYNHGTNSMWTHLKRAHPIEHAVLKPHEWNLSLNEQYRAGLVGANSGMVPGTSAGAVGASYQTIARPPPKDAEDKGEESYEERDESP